MHHTKAGRRPHTPKQRPAIYLSNTALKSAGSASLKNAGSACKARDADVRGAGLWPTGVHEAPCMERSSRQVPWRTRRRLRFCITQKRRFWPARRTEPLCTGVHEAPWNAAGQVLHHSTRPSRARRGRLRGLPPSAHVPWPRPPRPSRPRCCRRCRRRRAPRRSQRACRR